jgi:hypothetical protein
MVEDLLFAGRSSQCRITIDGVTLTAYSDDHMLGIGDRVRVTVKSFMRLEGEGK